MKGKPVLPLLGFILFGFSCYIGKSLLPEILNSFPLQIAVFMIEILSFILISFLFYNRLEEIKKRPEKLPLLFALISLLFLTRRIYIGYGIMELALEMFVLNLIIFLWIAFSKKCSEERCCSITYQHCLDWCYIYNFNPDRVFRPKNYSRGGKIKV